MVSQLTRLLLFLLVLTSCRWTDAFVHPSATMATTTTLRSFVASQPAAADSNQLLLGTWHASRIQAQRALSQQPSQLHRSSVRTMGGLFGLGLAEIAIIAIVATFLLGPQNMGRILKASGKRTADMAQELKKVPEEFQKGVEEGETDARARKARPVKQVVRDDDENNEG